jgi:hypothetical protein
MGTIADILGRWPQAQAQQTLRTVALGSLAGLAGGLVFAVLANATSPVLGLLGVCGLLVAGVVALSPPAGYLLLAFSVPLERIGRLTDDWSSFTISLSRVAGLLALGAFLLHACIRKWKVRTGLACWLYGGYVAMAAASILWADAPKDAIRDTGRVVGNLMFFFLVVNIARSFRLVRAGTLVWLLVTTLAGLYGIYSYHFGADRLEEAEMGLTAKRSASVVADDAETRLLGMKVARAMGTTSHPTLWGVNMTLTLPFFAWIIRTERWRWKMFWFGGFLIAAYNIVISNTRAVLLLAALTLVLIVLRGLWPLDGRSFFALALAGAALLPLLPEDFIRRSLDASLYTTKSDSIRMRFKFLAKSWEIAQEHWPAGIGIGNQTMVVRMITDEHGGRITPDGLKASAHNEYLWVLVEVGILGWLFHWSFVALILWYSFRAARIFRRFPDTAEQYWYMIAAQITLIGIPFFALQTEAFHFGLKGWWLVAALSTVMLSLAQRHVRAERAAAAAGSSVLVLKPAHG